MISAPCLHRRLKGAPSSRPVWVEEGGQVDRRMLHTEIERCRRILTDIGVVPHDFVALQLTPGMTLFSLLLALWSLDARAVLLDHRLTASETQARMELCPPRFHLTARTPATALTTTTEPLIVEELADQHHTTRPICLTQFTSGSTGRPKVVGRSAESLWAELDRYAAIDGMPGADDRLLLLSSPVHTWGLIGGILHGLASDLPVLFPPAHHGAAVVRAARALEATVMFGVSTHFELLSNTAQAQSLDGIRMAVSAGMVTEPEVSDLFRRRTGCPLGQIYGMTELGVITADLFGRTPGTVGIPTKGMTLRTDDGELYIRVEETPYLCDDGVSRFEDGWLRAFDRAELDAATGAMTILGRADSLIAVGGIKIDLLETERVLQSHPDVTTAVVVFGTSIEAHLEVTDDLTESALAEWARARLTPHKLPKCYYLHTDFARTPTGKAIRDREQLLVHFHRNRQELPPRSDRDDR